MVPKENIRIFSLLYDIETLLRELIIDALQGIIGPKWYKTRLPQHVYERSVEGMKYERNIKWTQLICYHPIYYTEFPHLKEIIIRRDNWDDTFEKIFKRKEIVISNLSILEPIRNKIAHNRQVTTKDFKIINGAYVTLSEIIGEKYFRELKLRNTTVKSIPDRLSELQQESYKLFQLCKRCDPIDIVVWVEIKNVWWFDESYLGHNIDGIINYFRTMEIYIDLPRGRGVGHLIESWVKDNDIDSIYNKSLSEFKSIASDWR